jgi:hypothetical protein
MTDAPREIDLIIESQPNWRGDLLKQLRRIILDSTPGIQETVKWKMPSKPLGSPTWELNGIICVADYLKGAVRLTFRKGALLDDVDGLFNCRLDSKEARGIDFPENAVIDEKALVRLVAAAAKL